MLQAAWVSGAHCKRAPVRSRYPCLMSGPEFPITELLPRIRQSLAEHPRLVL
jgi:hypothetical protein